jgi:hypothetical protein
MVSFSFLVSGSAISNDIPMTAVEMADYNFKKIWQEIPCGLMLKDEQV